MNQKPVRLLVLLFVLLATAMVAPAQITGDIRGVVLDGSGAGVGNATVNLKSLETGDTRSMTSDAEGRFTFNLLKIGLYEARRRPAFGCRSRKPR